MPAPVLQFKRGNAGIAGTVPALRPGEPAISLNNFDFFIGIDTSVANNKFFGSHRYWGREDGTNSLKLKLVDKDGTNYVAIKTPDTLAGIVTYILPGTQGASQTVLTNDGSGNLSWSSGSLNAVFSGITTIGGSLLDVNADADFSGITTFSNTTDNTLGDPNTGAVQIDGGLGVNKNVTIGAGLSVTGHSHFIGTATFYGGQINLGDSDTDDIVVAGEFKSNLIPSNDATYSLGTGAKRWNNASFAGIGSFDSGVDANNITIGIGDANTVTTSTGKLILHSATGVVEVANRLDVVGDLDVTGNVYIGGTTVTLRGADVFIENKDIVLGYTTSVTPNDTTANHAGVAIASTEGTPLVSFEASGINTLPDTYKQMMWFQSGTLGFATDAFAFNYGVAIGTTTMADGVRLAVGSDVTITDDTINATSATFANLSATNITGTLTGTISTATRALTIDTVTASDLASTHYITFVNSHNGAATAENVYTDDGIYYNPGTNTFTTQHALFTGNVEVQGTLTGTATTATRSTTVDTTSTSTNATYYVPFVDTLGGQNGETVRVGAGLSLNPSDGSVATGGILSVGVPANLTSYIKAGGGSNAMYLYGNGDVSFQAKVITNSIRSSTDSNNAISLSGRDVTLENNVIIVGVTTIGTGVGITQFSASVSTGSSTSSVPTSSAIIDYIDSQVGNVDLTLSIAGDTGTGSVNTSQIFTIAGTPNEVNTSASGQTITVGLPDDVIVGTSLSAPTIRTNIIQSQNSGATVLTITNNDATFADDLTVQGNLYVNGSTTQVNTQTLTVEDRLIESGKVQTPPPDSTWDVGILFNYYKSSVNKRAGVFWDDSVSRLAFASETTVTNDTDTTQTDPLVTVNTWAPIEIGSLWVNDCAGQSQVISCTGTERFLQNITVDAGTF